MFGLSKVVVWLVLSISPATPDKPAVFALLDVAPNVASCEALKAEVLKQIPDAPLMCVSVIPKTRI